MAQKAGIGKYLYWSDRAIRQVTQENGIELGDRRNWTIGVHWRILEATLGNRARVTRNQLSEARIIEKAIGDVAVEDFDSPPPAAFVKGMGKVSFAEFVGGRPSGGGVLMHVQSFSAAGHRVDMCLFGSLANVRGFESHDDYAAGWTSSAAHAIQELIDSKGRQNTSQWDDEQSRAVEVLNVALNQGERSGHDHHKGRPETRGFTIGHAGDSHFFAEVYTDVFLDPQRWRLDGDMAGAERIIVGRPLWVRTLSPAAVVRYSELRYYSAAPRLFWRRRGH